MQKLVAICACLAWSFANAGTTAPSRVDATPDKPASLDQLALPKEYKGHKCRVLASRLAKLDAVKGEFETTEKFQARLEAIKTINLSGSIYMGSLLAFAKDIDAENVSYDADARMLKIRYVSPSISNLANSDVTAGFISDLKEASSKTYSGSNAYGKTVNVKQTVYDGCAVGFVNFVRIDAYGAGKTIEREMEIEDAKVTKANLAVLYLGQLTEPYSSKYENYKKPTIDFPYESVHSGRMILIRVEQTWIYNKKTGVIYEKF
jgi:hypothetical protein